MPPTSAAGKALSRVLVPVLLAAVPLQAGTIRDDRLDGQYTALANQQAFAAVGQFDWWERGRSYLASGTLINNQWVLTAAHVVSGIKPGNIGTMTFTVGGQSYHVSEAYVHAGWNKDVGNGNDIGLVRLSSVAAGITPAYLYSGTDESQKLATVVGYGVTGTGLTGATLPSGTKRAGTNVTALGSVLNGISWTGGGNDNMLVADFDQPGPTGDPTTDLAVPTDLEYCGAPGDSGGSWFIQRNGLEYLAGVTSFLCSYPGNPQDAMYGDIFGSTRVSSYLSWVRQHTTYDLSVPGDANIDGRVDYLDLGVLASNYRLEGKSWPEADFNGDTLVDYLDLGLLASNYRFGTGAGPVPEPASLSLLALGVLAATRRAG